MRAIVGALLITACAGGAAAATPNTANFGNWETTCDGGGGCSTWAWGGNWGAPGYVVLNVEPDGDRTLLLGAGAYAETPRKEISAFRVRIIGSDGVLWSRSFASRTWYPATLEGRLERPGEIDIALSALRDGERVEFDVVGETTRFTTISLKGSAAALLWIGSHHGVDQSMPAINRAPVVSQAGIPSPAPATIARCDASTESETPPFGYRLAPGKLLWISKCGGAGYNRGAILTLADEAGRVLPGPTFDTSDDIDPSDGNPSYDPKTRTLASVFYSNGTRTCGNANQWVWDGRMFRSSKFAGASECEGLRESDWPVTYRARIIDR
jgi:hypothetical protein